MDEKFCPGCEAMKSVSAFSKRARSKDGLQRLCKSCDSIYKKQLPTEQKTASRRRWAEKLRQAALDHYGRACVCCGESESRFLTFDHKNDDGYLHRAEVGSQSIYLWLRNNGYPDSIQVLCANCNLGRAWNKGKCPHRG